MSAERPAPPRRRDASRTSQDQRDTLSDLAASGRATATPARHPLRTIEPSGLDERTAALARLAALVALRAAPASYRRCVDLAVAAGASIDDVVDTLKVVAPSVGLARVVSAAPGLALAVGYDIDAALEALDDPRADAVGQRVRFVGGRSPRNTDTGVPPERWTDPNP
jgi:4-carboxymuconolactone decarboxylase